MSFLMKRDPWRFGYDFTRCALKRVRDLGVTLTEGLSFNTHMDVIIAKYYSMLVFVKRICSEFRSVVALKSIYFVHVRTHLEYASDVWAPYYQRHNDKIEYIQKRFVL